MKKESFNFNSSPPMVTVEAAYSKHRRQDVLPLRPDTAEAMKQFLRNRLPGSPVFSGIPYKCSEMIKYDLESAGIPYVKNNRYADFHALRHTFISNLVLGGVHPKVTQELARHSTITLTMDRYTHTTLENQTEALAKLPALQAVSSIRAAQ